MRRTIILAAAILISTGSSMTAQNLPEGVTLKCATPDGLVTITDQGFSVADHDFRCTDIPKDGIALFADPSTGALATLDARSDEGLYIEVKEGGSTMLLVVDRNKITYGFDRSASLPTSPAFSLNFFRLPDNK
ncbi:MAG: hypothetical protein M5R41_17280 [Bacteroidia bacterium]|nr:hypothetical protein [Bacteroidia bacterium]